ncbi:MAG TPA: hypothetical protein DEQ30_06580 [Porphyromonadaceae bacterium]|nr:hypothetical protein [Porphyromonadaceae bacterium]
MKYLSPIRLFEYCDIAYSDPDLSKIKRIISAEYALADNGIIAIDGFDYTKDSILQEIERDDFRQRLVYHDIIWKNKSLLNVLERDSVDEHTDSWFYLSENEDFRQFVSPFFAYAFNKIMHKYLRDFFLLKASAWLKYLAFVNFVDENPALADTRDFISDTLRLFRNTNKSNYKNNLSRIGIWAKQPVYLFINNLPESLSDETEDLVIALINFTVEIQSTNKKLCCNISENLFKITNADERHIETIRKNHKIYKSKVGKKSRWRHFLKWGFIFIFVSKILPFIVGLIIGLFSLIFGWENDGKDRSSSGKKKYSAGAKRQKDRDQSIYTISGSEFCGIREEYTRILQDTSIVLVTNKPVPLTKDLYFFMIENNPAKEHSGLRVINRSLQKINCYISGCDEYAPMDFVVEPGIRFTMDVRHCCFNIMFAVIDSSRTGRVAEEPVVPVLISDSIDLSPRIIQTDYTDKPLHLWNPEELYDFTIEFSQDSIFIYPKEHNELGWSYTNVEGGNETQPSGGNDR